MGKVHVMQAPNLELAFYLECHGKTLKHFNSWRQHGMGRGRYMIQSLPASFFSNENNNLPCVEHLFFIFFFNEYLILSYRISFWLTWYNEPRLIDQMWWKHDDHVVIKKNFPISQNALSLTFFMPLRHISSLFGCLEFIQMTHLPFYSKICPC